MMSLFFFFNDTATTEIYTLSLHDALPISYPVLSAVLREAAAPSNLSTARAVQPRMKNVSWPKGALAKTRMQRSEEHTSELQSRLHLVCRLLLEKKKKSTLTGLP